MNIDPLEYSKGSIHKSISDKLVNKRKYVPELTEHKLYEYCNLARKDDSIKITEILQVIDSYIYFVEKFFSCKNERLGIILNNVGVFIWENPQYFDENGNNLIIKCCELGIKFGCRDSYFNLGLHLMNNKCANEKKMKDCFKNAIKYGITKSAFYLGNHYLFAGKARKAIKYWEFEIGSGGILSFSNLGLYHYDSSYVTEIKKGINIWKKGHALGNIICTSYLATHYYKIGYYKKMETYCNTIFKYYDNNKCGKNSEKGLAKLQEEFLGYFDIIYGKARCLVGFIGYCEGNFYKSRYHSKIGSELGNADCQALLDEI